MTKRFLEQVAERLIQHAEAGGKRAVVLPNRRAGVFLRYAISQQSTSPTLSPTILTIEEFFFQLTGLVKTEQVEQLFALYHAYSEVTGQNDIDDFLTWGPTFLSDCNELDTNLVDADAFFTELYYDRELRNWKPNEELTEMQKDYLAFWKTAKDIYKTFTSNLLEQNKAYGGLAYRFAIEDLERFADSLPFEHVLFVGFNALNKAEEALFDFFLKSGKADALWDIDSYYFNDTNHKAGQYFRNRYQRWWPNSIWKNPPKNIGQHTERFEIIEAKNNASQCEVAGEILAQLSELGPLNNKTAIVLSDEQLLHPLLFHLPQDVGTYNITMGKALTQFPLYHLFDQLFVVAASAISGKKGWAYPASALKPILFSPFLSRLSDEPIGEELFDFISTKNAALLWENAAAPILEKSSNWAALLQPKKDVLKLLGYMNGLIEQLRISYLDADDRVPIQLLFEFKKITNQLISHQRNTDLISFAHMRSLFRQVCTATKLPYEGEPLQGLQIMGVLETRALDFENIIVLSANESILPKGRTGNSFIPHVFKQQYDIQTFKDRDAIYAYSFYRLLHHAKRVFLVYNGLEGKMEGGEPSRFIMQLKAEFEAKTGGKTKIQSYIADHAVTENAIADWHIEKEAEVLEKIVHFLQHRGLSASSINKLVRNPLDFYFQYIVQLRVPDALEENIEANTFGSIVHHSLEVLYAPYIGQVLTQDAIDTMFTKASEVLTEQFGKHYQQGTIDRGMNHLMRKAADVLVEEALKLDAERIKKERIRLIGLEETYARSLELNLHGKAVEVKLQGKIDRIQEVDGIIEIIDYKTGKVNAPRLENLSKIHNDIRQDKLVQLLVYASLLEQHYSLESLRPCLQSLRSWQKGLVYLNNQKGKTIHAEDLDLLKTELELILEQLLDTTQPFTPESLQDRLRYSDYTSIYS
ncbi:MAG: PD-(D/E)XK nuclease family protein [Saprospiraceae bacterium]|nr:PD-(D/E)XK nuclease family protein [Saprospiraceae bacterium]